MSPVIDRAAWSPDEQDEFENLLAEVVASSRDTTARLDHFDKALTDAIQAQRGWATDVARSCRREGLAREVKRYQDRQRVSVSYDGRVLSVPAVQSRKVVGAEGAVTYQRELIELWTWEQVLDKRSEAIRSRGTYDEKVAHYDRLLALRELAPDSATPHEAADLLGIDLDSWLGGDVAA